MLMGTISLSPSVDIWQLGVSLYNLITNRWPFMHAHRTKQVASVSAGVIAFPSEFNFTPEAVDIISKMAAVQPDERLSIEEVLKHPYLAAVTSDVPPLSPRDLISIYNMAGEEKQLVEQLMMTHQESLVNEE